MVTIIKSYKTLNITYNLKLNHISIASQAYADPTFTLFWSKDKSAVVTEENALKLTENFPLKVIVHGFKAFTSSESEWMDTMKNAIFDAVKQIFQN